MADGVADYELVVLKEPIKRGKLDFFYAIKRTFDVHYLVNGEPRFQPAGTPVMFFQDSPTAMGALFQLNDGSNS